MSAFSEAALEKKLSELSNSQQSVQTLSLWLIHHRKHSRTIVNVWSNELKKGKFGMIPASSPLSISSLCKAQTNNAVSQWLYVLANKPLSGPNYANV